MHIASKTSVRTTSTILVAAMFGFVALFGLTLAMQTNEHGAMSDCPFMSEHAVACSMGTVEHIAQWQSLFATTVSQFGDNHIILALIVVLATIAAAARAPTILYASSPSPPRHQSQPESRLFNVLVTIFSQGILHPRLYA